MDWSSKRVLVTGAGGFIGSNVVEALVSRGAKVSCFIRYKANGEHGALDLRGEDRVDLRMDPPHVGDAALQRGEEGRLVERQQLSRGNTRARRPSAARVHSRRGEDRHAARRDRAEDVPSLQHLDLSHNEISRVAPEIQNCTLLRKLILSQNFLSEVHTTYPYPYPYP